MFRGVPHSICCHGFDDVIVDPGPESCVETLFEALGDEAPRAILLTHIHLDHAGAAGAVVERWPETDVWVHERGARHIIDPSRLVASATRIYGDKMGELWGRIVPVDPANVRILRGDGGTVGDGLRWAYTPGHASHHVSYLHEGTGTAYVGDVCGVRIAGGPVIAPTPPPDIDVEAWNASLDIIAGWEPSSVAVTHYGRFDDVATQIAGVRQSLHELAAMARELDAEGFERAMRKRMDEDPSYTTSVPPETLYEGLARYWQMRENRSQ